MEWERGAGVLLHVSSLPSPYGIGDFGRGGREFVDLLASMRMKWWQILPLCPVGQGDSPYSSSSVFAIEPMFIDPLALVEDGLLTREEARAAEYPGAPYSVDYPFAREAKERLLRLAYSRADGGAVNSFAKEHAAWLPAYARFMANRKKNNGAPWWEWRQQADEADSDYYVFEQMIADRQWRALRAYANSRGVRVLGDMPIYVARDSADFWSDPAQFQTDAQGNPQKVAGVPPDYFAQDGQLWGNPLYDWERMAQDGYRWWLGRMGRNLSLYDAVRIDHFRGFHRYWAVPATAKTAREGTWEEGPGMRLFQIIEQTFDRPQIVAEDLGAGDEGLFAFLQAAGYPGMKVLQFGFSGENSAHIPYRYPQNCIAYPGTHDNDTMLGWLWAIPMEEKKRLLRYCRFAGDSWGEGGPHSVVIQTILTTLWETAACVAIVPMQDLCGFGTDTRMNIPGQAEGNWRFRITREAMAAVDVPFYRTLNRTYGRDEPPSLQKR